MCGALYLHNFLSFLVRLLLCPFVKGLSGRLEFEKKYPISEFKLRKVDPKVCFEVSSEGELEQIRPVLEYFLEKEIGVELIFFSPSVEKKCVRLREMYRNLSIAAYPALNRPIFSSPIKKYVQSKTLCLCRYDFFPDLIDFAKSNTGILFSATLKNKNKKSSILKRVYKSFDLVFCATKIDQDEISKLINHSKSTKVYSYEFRLDRILSRVLKAKDHLDSFSFWAKAESILNNFEKKNRIALGNFWDYEIPIFTKAFTGDVLDKKNITFIAPHLIGKEQIEKLLSSLEEYVECPVYLLEDESFNEELFFKSPGLVIVKTPGLLVELYTFFGHAYVSGGFGRSVHSILEPFVAGANIYCGIKTHRSTEYDLALELSPTEVLRLSRIEDFYSTYLEKSDLSNTIKRKGLLQDLTSLRQEHFEKIEKLINGV